MYRLLYDLKQITKFISTACPFSRQYRNKLHSSCAKQGSYECNLVMVVVHMKLVRMFTSRDDNFVAVMTHLLFANAAIQCNHVP